LGYIWDGGCDCCCIDCGGGGPALNDEGGPASIFLLQNLQINKNLQMRVLYKKKINIENWYIVYAIWLSKTILSAQWKSVFVDVFLLVVDHHSISQSSINMINY
jgi:hypothetical protein